MDFLLNRYRNLSMLLVVIFAQLLLLAYQVKSDKDIPLIRVWAVTGITPIARVIEAVRSHSVGFVEDYFVLLKVRDENRRLKEESGRMKMENQFLRAELSMADRVKALAGFQERTPSKTIAARVIATGTGANSKVVFIDRGSSNGIMRGMAVVTPDGIVGKVTAAYPTAAQVMLATDPSFAAGVISQKNRVHGTLRGQGRSDCQVDYVQNEETVEVGEWFYTSGDDRIFPKGMPVGQVRVVRQGKNFSKEIYLVPSGLQSGVEEVLVVVEGVHQEIPQIKTAATGEVALLPPPPESGKDAAAAPAGPGTEADKLRERYRRIGEAQNHPYGDGVGRTPNFNIDPDAVKKPAPAAGGQPAGAAQKPAGSPPANTPAPAEARPASAKPPAVKPDGATRATPPAPKPKPAPPAVQ